MDEFNKQLKALYEEYSDRFYAAAYAVLQNKEDAEDAVSETFLRLIENREKFQQVADEKRVAYAKTVLKNAALDMIRKRKNHANDELSEDISAMGLSVEETAEFNDLQKRLGDHIRTMSSSLRQALYLRFNYNFTTKQTADALGISETAARKRLSDAQKQIKLFMEGIRNE